MLVNGKNAIYIMCEMRSHDSRHDALAFLRLGGRVFAAFLPRFLPVVFTAQLIGALKPGGAVI